MAASASRVSEFAARYGNEFPPVALRAQINPQDSERGVASYFRGGQPIAKLPLALSSRTDDKFANAARGIGNAFRILRREALIVVIVAVEDHVGVGLVKRLPERLDFEIVAQL